MLEEIKSKLNLGNACCCSVKNFVSSCLISEKYELKYTQLYFCSCFAGVLNCHAKGRTYAEYAVRIGC
jgi:hypothetical protein